MSAIYFFCVASMGIASFYQHDKWLFIALSARLKKIWKPLEKEAICFLVFFAYLS